MKKLAITAADILIAVRDFDDYYVQSPANGGVHLGCDCGCGGDSYSLEDWEIAHMEGDRAYDRFKAMCHELGVIWKY